jgi:DNA-binding NarL/FixJ family response regulator
MRATIGMLCYEAGLTTTESSVLMLYADEGLAYEAIANRLGLTAHAVQCHASNAGRKIRDHCFRRQQLEEDMDSLREQLPPALTLPEAATSGP